MSPRTVTHDRREVPLLRVSIPILLTACLSQELESEPSAVSPPVADPQKTQDPACVAHATDVPGVDAADPRLKHPHLLVVQKAARRVQVFQDGVAVTGGGIDGHACYRVGLGPTGEGHKQREGDGRTPEGWYTTSDKPWSSYYAAIAVHYPNAADAQAGLADQRITAKVHDQITQAVRAGKKPPQTTALGGEILLHGGGGTTDWTLGCIALDDADIDDLRTKLPATKVAQVHILP